MRLIQFMHRDWICIGRSDLEGFWWTQVILRDFRGIRGLTWVLTRLLRSTPQWPLRGGAARRVLLPRLPVLAQGDRRGGSDVGGRERIGAANGSLKAVMVYWMASTWMTVVILGHPDDARAGVERDALGPDEQPGWRYGCL